MQSIFSAMPLRTHRSFVRPSMVVLPALVLAAGMGLLSCSGRQVSPPDAEFLVTTADSAFWVRSGTGGIHIKGVPMTLAHFGGRFHEVFIADVDRSFDDAVFTGERVYVRDLRTNDSSLVYDDTAIEAMARHHARIYPDAVPLGPNDDAPDDPEVSATGETDVLEVRGEYALLEHRVTYDMPGGSQHDTVHTAIDLRTGLVATAADMVRDASAEDSNLVSKVPRSWTRKGYMLDARATIDGSVVMSLGDRGHRSWQLLTVRAHPRIYWLDQPAIDAATRRALVRAFNAAAAYDESVKYVRFVRPAVRQHAAPLQRHA